VVGRATHEGVAGKLVVVPHVDERVLAVHQLEIGVASIERVAAPVVVQADELARWVEVLAEASVDLAVLHEGAVLVEVVAQVHHRVEVGPPRHHAVGIEVPEAQVGARRERQADLARAAHRRRLRAADGGRSTERAEAEVVGGAWLERREVCAHGVVTLGVRGHVLGHAPATHGRVGGHFEEHAHGGGAVAPRGHARPQHHGVGERVARGHAVLERVLGTEGSFVLVERKVIAFIAPEQDGGRQARSHAQGGGSLDEVASVHVLIPRRRG
jgi:hypothetical protein